MRENTLGFALRSAKDLDNDSPATAVEAEAAAAEAEAGGRADASDGRWWNWCSDFLLDGRGGSASLLGRSGDDLSGRGRRW